LHSSSWNRIVRLRPNDLFSDFKKPIYVVHLGFQSGKITADRTKSRFSNRLGGPGGDSVILL